MDPQPPPDEVVDFSNYMKEPQPHMIHQNATFPSPYRPTKRLWFFIIILILMVLAQVAVLYLNKTPQTSIPAGYHIVKPANGPPKVEKVK